MRLSISSNPFGVVNCNENKSPQVVDLPEPSPKRKAGLISPPCELANSSTTAAAAIVSERDPLSDLPSAEEDTMVVATINDSNAALPTRQSFPFSATNSTHIKNELLTTGMKYNRFKAQQLTKNEIEATDEKQASVNQISEWLTNETAKKNIKKPPIQSTHHPVPVRFATKPRIKKSDVEATDDKRVSVKTLSSWMSDDPFEQKKNVRIIRTGHNVITKSRAFEKDQELKADRQCDIKPGSVEERLAWLSGAFKHDGDENTQPFQGEKKVVRTYQSTHKKEEKPSEGPKLELMSVREKKEWLSKAFKNKSDVIAIHQTNSFDSHELASSAIHQTKSFGHKDDNTASNLSIAKSATFDDSCVIPTIDATKSFDGIGRLVTKSFENRQDTTLHLVDLNESEIEVQSRSNEQTSKQFAQHIQLKHHPPVNDSQNENKVRPKEALKHHTVTDLQLANKLRERRLVAEGLSNQGIPMIATKFEKEKEKDIFRKLPAASEKLKLEASENTGSTGSIDGIGELDKMSVSDRAKWLKGAFKK